MTVFEFKDYRKAFASLFAHEKKLRAGHWSLAQLGQKTRIQPSYLTNVTKQRAHLNSDQIYEIADAIGLPAAQTEYLNLLMQWERASHARRKETLKQAVDAMRKEHLRVGRQLEIPESPLTDLDRQRYYLDPNIELLHLFLGTQHAPSDLKELARLWALPEKTVSDVIGFLQKTGLVRLKGKKWIVEPIRQYLPRESPLCKPQQMLKRLRAIETLQRIPEAEAYTFAATATMSEDTKLAIQSRFIEFLKEAESLIHESPAERIYQLQFDLFPWL